MKRNGLFHNAGEIALYLNSTVVNSEDVIVHVKEEIIDDPPSERNCDSYPQVCAEADRLVKRTPVANFQKSEFCMFDQLRVIFVP